MQSSLLEWSIMYYLIEISGSSEAALSEFLTEIGEPAAKGEFQYLDHNDLLWRLRNDKPFSFKDFYYANNQVPIFSQPIWEDALSIIDTDGVFQIPLKIEYQGEQHRYTIAIPSRIRCLDQNGHILSNLVGRYDIFRSENLEDHSIYVSERLKNKWSHFTSIKYKRS